MAGIGTYIPREIRCECANRIVALEFWMMESGGELGETHAQAALQAEYGKNRAFRRIDRLGVD
jgi:hypothetical protein